ncbi:hypothetical protein R3W88_001295 [Solanum pinnatisectum]|uniref:Endonuclease/exonuclease/phosphatase domain-containing protein n=1 Tax=Solanum pinnatisectum TaxID=50273 RepID=A0AAV9MID3_9SOLN|nr:hypothetical protein R3W88_001295 [Solanum pinnatisectum]
MEPFEDSSNIDTYKRILGHHTAFANNNGKIWLFSQQDIQIQIISDINQHLTIMAQHQNWTEGVLLTVVYAACNASIRMELWESLSDLARQYTNPWLVGGDFNVILSEEEKLGGLQVYYQETEDFANFNGGLFDMGYSGSIVTLWNGRTDTTSIFKRLDRILCNQRFIDKYPNVSVKHLIKKGSDHSPL